MSWVCGVGMWGSGGGWEYSFIGSLYFSISKSRVSGKNGNSFVIIFIFIGSLFLTKS